MTAPARLLGLRLQGFKSFAERTVVEFGSGISAIVGPNGSGKSNLADALRWALGEQGRALRSRRAEDVIWAGSERRAAVGMADVTLMLDNSDGLLPVDYRAIELGRRLYRSGENDYLLNRQRVRLRDLIDLLDSASLADNAFLFIGQGMVDQALALRPEERRPLFEEVAGVRRHERRRRRAEEHLVDSEANLARVEDILAELRPQARRLAAQAEQQATRATAGAELADALLLAAHARWYETARRLAAAEAARATATSAVERARRDSHEAEVLVTSVATELGGRAAIESEARHRHDAARSALTALQLREARLQSEAAAIDRDRARLRDERAAAEADLAIQRRSLAVDEPLSRDEELDEALAAAERELAEALGELAALRAADRARDQELAAVHRAVAAREAEIDTAQWRLRDARRRAQDGTQRLTAIREREAALGQRRDEAAETVAMAVGAAEQAAAAVESARQRVEETEAARVAAAGRLAEASAVLAPVLARKAELEARIRSDASTGFARHALDRGGRPLDDGLVVERELSAAVASGLGSASRALVLHRPAVIELAGENGTAVVSEAAAAAERSRWDVAFLARVADEGGGPLSDAIIRDPSGGVRALLVRTAWLPSLAACLALQSELPAGWLLVTRDGSAIVTELTVTFGRSDAAIGRKTELAELAADVETLTGERDSAALAARSASEAAETARLDLERARRLESTAAGDRRRAEDVERVAERELEAVVRERAWHEAQATRLDGEVSGAEATVAGLNEAAPRGAADARSASPSSDAVAIWEARARDMRAQRDRLAAQRATLEAERHEADARRARSEAAIALDGQRIARADRETAELAARAEALGRDGDALRAELSTAGETEIAARKKLDALLAAEAADRSRLAAAEAAASNARDRLHRAEEQLRVADHAELEARFAVESLREQVLVELAGLGELGLEHLRRLASSTRGASDRNGPAPTSTRPTGTSAFDTAAPDTAATAGPDTSASDAAADDLGDNAAFETALDLVAPGWAAAPPAGEPPSPGRLASLRRRYHELGAANPFAVEEYAEVRDRLASLQAQEADLRAAIESTRSLIAELNTLIGEQFRTTFRALEAAFDRRFNQLFGGGYAKLSLTEPGDLAQTGVEIVARPPGKKAQALAMLSGGERALTAVALLFAMLEVRPVPFCVLDEVDAALDEANVGRFSDALRGLADRTQFIVITHNRGTIEVADALYGVTVGEDSVSRVISLRLDEAQALAERQGAGQGSVAGRGVGAGEGVFVDTLEAPADAAPAPIG